MQAESDGSLEPKYVIGFYDNYPKVGENIFKLEINILPDTYYRCDPPPINYIDKNIGPDGVDLGLLCEGEKIRDETELYYEYFCCYEGGGVFPKCAIARVTEFLFGIGPFLYLVQVLDIYCDGQYGATLHVRTSRGINTTELYETIRNLTATTYRSPAHCAIDPEDDLFGGIYITCDWWNEYDNMTYVPGLFISAILGTVEEHDWSNAKFYVRPHTKEELIEAGLLNADGTLPEVPE